MPAMLETLLLLGAAIAPANAFWRMECRGVLANARMDPIVNPGDVSSHSHAILGSGGFSESADYDSLVNGDCTSCLVTQDKSAYWHPQLWFEDKSTGKYELVPQVGGTLAYYFLNSGNGNTNITSFPKGFRMIAGDNDRREFTAGNYEQVDPPKALWASLGQDSQEYLGQRALGFNCLDYSGTTEASLYRHFFPDKNFLDSNCPDGIRFELMFPSCWNGKDLDSDNHRDHVAYPSQLQSGDCPDDYPVRFPGLFYETIWGTNNFKDREGQFVIANGDVSGFAYHGDFMMGWDSVDTLQQAIDTCTSESGEIYDCPVFDIQSEAKATECKVDTPSNLKSETATSGLTSLPGDLQPFGVFIGATINPSYDSALASAKPTAIDGTAAGGIKGSGGSSPTAGSSSPAKTSAPAVTSSAASSPAASSPAASSPAASSPAPTTSSASSAAATTPGGAIFAEVASSSSSSSAAPAPSSSSSSSAAAPALDVPAAKKVSTLSTSTLSSPAAAANGALSTEYVTANGVVTEVLWEEATIFVTEGMTTETVTANVPVATPAVKARNHAHNHMRRHGQHAHGRR